MTTSTIQGLKPQNLVAERDFTFGMKPKEEPIPQRKASEKERVVEIQTRLLLVRVSYHLFEALRRLTTNIAAASFRNYGGILTAESRLLQDPHRRH